MEASRNYLRVSDVFVDLKNERTHQPQDLLCKVIQGGTLICFVAMAILKTANFVCLNDCEPFNFTTSFYTALNFGVIYSVSALFYLFFKSVAQVNQISKLIGDSNSIVSQVQYNKLVEMLGTNISPDLEKKFYLPSETEKTSILEKESEILSSMLDQIISGKCDYRDIYANAINHSMINSETVFKFLESSLNEHNFVKISRFAEQNEIGNLISICKVYFTNMINTDFDEFFRKRDK